MIETGPLRPEDRAAWDVLARGYKTFYQESEPDEAYEQTWRRLAAGTELFGLGARLDGRLVGIAHYFFHPAVWSGEACYLQDLFTDEAARGRGAARALIEAVAAAARERGALPARPAACRSAVSYNRTKDRCDSARGPDGRAPAR
jgi:GNAT superfamily N-acetyltransferase